MKLALELKLIIRSQAGRASERAVALLEVARWVKLEMLRGVARWRRTSEDTGPCLVSFNACPGGGEDSERGSFPPLVPPPPPPPATLLTTNYELRKRKQAGQGQARMISY
ncbi:hypothetical protein TEQG_04434 [Trichophyton equinum CBS 127.97]|uniref:Uncharacterized protein n=1 Tax=Trichophyton equinum (strain ATCC MYA-4606 / CBS 127.97) TaxID=559882 RepID=F2PTR0_TRIEC|nr:hypothetical protein TEQG_04434 [Trichophyton equinum CBS 127.97]